MTEPSRLLVLIVRNAALRSTLAARLALAGEAVVTVERCDAPQLGRLRRDSILVVSGSALEGEPAGWPALLRAQGWQGKIAILADTAGIALPPAGEDDVAVIGAKNPIADLLALLARWRPPTILAQTVLTSTVLTGG